MRLLCAARRVSSEAHRAPGTALCVQKLAVWLCIALFYQRESRGNVRDCSPYPHTLTHTYTCTAYTNTLCVCATQTLPLVQSVCMLALQCFGPSVCPHKPMHTHTHTECKERIKKVHTQTQTHGRTVTKRALVLFVCVCYCYSRCFTLLSFIRSFSNCGTHSLCWCACLACE